MKMNYKSNIRNVAILLILQYANIEATSKLSGSTEEFKSKVVSKRQSKVSDYEYDYSSDYGDAQMQSVPNDGSESQSSNVESSNIYYWPRPQPKKCLPSVFCDESSPYRTIDGTCNNLQNVYWGAAGIPFTRYLYQSYGPGDTPRGTGQNLPGARNVSAGLVAIVNNSSLVKDPITLMVMQWGQFLDHDMVSTPQNESVNATICCIDTTHPACFSINVTGDPFYSSHGVTCLGFVRSKAAACTKGRQQINELTAFIDASQVYGSTPDELTAVREPNSYLLKFGPGKEVSSCPATNPDISCRSFLPVRNNSRGSEEFFAGDSRVQEQPGLTSLHTVFLRMHNDLATQMKAKNPNCSNEIIFQETRKLVGALVQQVTYDEFLPLVLGPDVMTRLGLTLGNFGGYSKYTNPSAPNVFATASYRFGHSLIPNFFNLPLTLVELARSFNNHERTKIPVTFPSEFMKGIAIDSAEPMDHILADAVHNKLFAANSTNFSRGGDLYARNIQRGRDHGIPAYVKWLDFNDWNGCFRSFKNNLSAFIPSDVLAKINSLYSNNISNADLFPLGIAEVNLPGAILGPTFACINGAQFHDLKYGDRFWFENKCVFSANQRASIRSTTLSSILCRYTDATNLQQSVMKPISVSNPNTSCTNRTGVFKDIGIYWTNLCGV